MAVLGSLTDDLIKSVFLLFDQDGSHRIDAEECCLALSALGLPASREDVDAHISTIGATHTLSLQEFTHLVRAKAAECAPCLERQLFDQFDHSGHGVITPHELSAMASALGEPCDRRVLEDLCAEVTAQHGAFDFSAWQHIMATEHARTRRHGTVRPQPDLRAQPYAIGAPLQFETARVIHE
eukprot:TRINITY_DN8473_c0_g1_i1.p1 TRINITY_DN8473_c0_g1~~TRINITY_DN8473_c0_g1_i1.p1  ORF type:complete len:182 (+),score=11.19 TRINITY_DN8473_c0_g1_i1:113-658(+)